MLLDHESTSHSFSYSQVYFISILKAICKKKDRQQTRLGSLARWVTKPAEQSVVARSRLERTRQMIPATTGTATVWPRPTLPNLGPAPKATCSTTTRRRMVLSGCRSWCGTRPLTPGPMDKSSLMPGRTPVYQPLSMTHIKC